jgi:acetyl esterase
MPAAQPAVARSRELAQSCKALLDAAAGFPDFADLTPPQARRAFARAIERCGGKPAIVDAIEEIEVPCRSGPRTAWIYRPVDQSSGLQPALLWLHGGGFVFGDLPTYDRLCRAFADAAKLTVVAFDYRLAPEAPFPAAIEDCEDAWRWLRARAVPLGLDPHCIGLAGDSAGGTLALATAMTAAAQGAPARSLVIAYPGVSLHLDTPSHARFACGHLLTRRTIEWCYRAYVPHDVQDDRLAPLHSPRLAALPPTCLVLAGCDPLADEGQMLATRLRELRHDVRVLDYPGMIHGFLSYPAAIPEASEALAEMGRVAHALTAAVPLHAR